MSCWKTLWAGSAALLLTSCSSGEQSGSSNKVTSETRKLDQFHSIALKVPANLTITEGQPGDTIIKTSESALPLIKTTVSDGVLTIEASESLHNIKELEITTATESLDTLTIKGAGKIDITGMKWGSLNIDAEGAGTISVMGKAESLTANLKGAGNLNSTQLTCDKVTVSIQGAGNADVDAEKELNASISGAGNIRYRGNPKLTQSIKGVGAISKAQ